MTIAETPSFYDAAVMGEPLQRTVFPAPINTTSRFWTIGEWSIRVPAPVPPAIPRLQRVIQEIRSRTSWSARRLAEAVKTTHTTILNAESGRPLVSGHSGDLRRRLLDVYDIVDRVYLLTGRDSQETQNLLATAPPNGRSAVDELIATGDPGAAYIAVLDVLRPRPAGIFVGDRPLRDGRTIALHE